MINNADDGRICWRFGRVERKRRLPATHEKHMFTHTRPNRIERDQRTTRICPGRGDRLNHEQRDPGKVGVLDRRYDFTDDARQLHYRPRSAAAVSTGSGTSM